MRTWGPWLWAGLPLCLLYLLPLWLLCTYDHIDSSIEWILNDGLAQGRRFGRDLVWTNGPLGVLWADQFHPATWARAFVLRLPFAVALWWAIGTVTMRRGALPRWGRLGLAFGLLAMSLYTRETAVYIAGALWWFMAPRPSAQRDDDWIPRLALIASLAPLALGKFTLLLMLAPMLAAHAAARVVGRRRPTLDALLFISLLPPIWLLCGQPLAGFAEWGAGSFEVIGSYAEGIPMRGDFLEIVVMLALAAGPLAWLARKQLGEDRSLAAFADLGGLVALITLIVRHGLTRQDHGHVAISGAALLGIGALFVVRGSVFRKMLLGWSALALSFLAVTGVSRGSDSTAPAIARRAATLPDRLRTLTGFATGHGPAEQASCEDARAMLRNAFPVTPPEGTVDLLPHDQVVIAAYELPYAPRPVPQSYSAYSASLEDRNAAFLGGPEAPDGLLFDIAPTDDFHPALADARSWTTILSAYDVTSLTGTFLTLQRRQEPRAVLHADSVRLQARLGEPLALPEAGDGMLWVEFDLQKTLLGRLGAAVMKPPELRISVQLADGRVSSHRITPSFARAGFFVSPHVDNRLAFAALVAENGRASGLLARATAMRIDVPSWSAGYNDSFEVTAREVEVPMQPGLRVPEGLGSLTRSHALPIPGPPRPHWLDGHGDGMKLFAHAPSRLRLPLTEPPRSLSMTMGFLDNAWKGTQATDGAEFVVLWRDATGADHEIGRKRLDPANQHLHRGPQKWTLPFPRLGAGPGVLELLVEQGETMASDWTYWSALEVR